MILWSLCVALCCFFFFKQKTAYEMRISDWSSDVCSSDLLCGSDQSGERPQDHRARERPWPLRRRQGDRSVAQIGRASGRGAKRNRQGPRAACLSARRRAARATRRGQECGRGADRSEEHTSELQSLMRISYAVFCLKKKHIT